MKKILLIAVIGALGFNAWQRISGPAPQATADRGMSDVAPNEPADTAQLQVERPADTTPVADSRADSRKYSCDGRVYCSQMTSCEEATYFLEHCPGVKMDGEGDGIPCERQWCGSRR
jgi:excalibur calcium-binding domain-containing protein